MVRRSIFFAVSTDFAIAFQQQFGVCDADGCRLESYVQSVMTAMPYLGKLLGCWTVTPITEKLGRKNMMIGIVTLSCVSVEKTRLVADQR